MASPFRQGLLHFPILNPTVSPYHFPKQLHAPPPDPPLRARIYKPLAPQLSRKLDRQQHEARVEHWKWKWKRNGLKIERGTKLLKDLSTWGIGGPCDYFVQVFNRTQLVSAVRCGKSSKLSKFFLAGKLCDVIVSFKGCRFCQENEIPFIIIGNGSNCLFDDSGFRGCVILNRIEFLERIEPGIYRVGSGFGFNRLGLQCSNEGFTGLEFAGGIPGTVGGAVYMNAGANGQRYRRNELNFGYRYSACQDMNDLAAIVEATFRLQSSGSARTRQLEYLERRKLSQPIREKSAGSVFRNPPDDGVSAAKLIEEAGLKGLRVGGAMVSKIHANFFINAGGSTSQDMLDLIDLVKGQVRRKFDIELQEEISYIQPCNF
ncbi:uncharacterized protein LOC116207947 isoform X2 [Punica granatum]|uniref:UDP-N-acetylmuramate dehydrogenase n=1 Tax=Punica granatum TaxID=22663 RepID=A0A6P8DUQ9_PUNGR|nr:uncharacterized protein LOC116207947 isoform X2 [Punica granatum]